MKKRVGKVGRSVLIFYGLIAIILFLLMTLTISEVKSDYYEEKIAASKLTQEAFNLIKSFRQGRGIPIDIVNDPKESGLLGHPYSVLTYERENLDEAQASLSPNFAALFVQFLKKARLKRGDTVGVGLDGSFPALNIALFSALKVLGIQPIITSAVASVSFGANDVNLTWLDMEDTLRKAKLFDFKTEFASLGGVEDLGEGLSPLARAVIKDKIENYGAKLLLSDSLLSQVLVRKEIYKSKPIKAFINVGKSAVNIGDERADGISSQIGIIRKGIAFKKPVKPNLINRFLKEGVKVINLSQPLKAKKEFDIKENLGSGRIYQERRYSVVLATFSLFLLIALLFLIIRYDLEYYLTKKSKRVENEKEII